jgi:hypothetical protein
MLLLILIVAFLVGVLAWVYFDAPHPPPPPRRWKKDWDGR